MAKVNVSTAISDLRGVKQELTLRDVCVQALLQQLPADRDMSGDEKYKLSKLARRIDQPSVTEVELKAEDIATLKRRIGEAFPPLTIKQAYGLIDPPADQTATN